MKKVSEMASTQVQDVFRIPSPLEGQTMTGAAPSDLRYEPKAMIPDALVLKIGGQSIMDRGISAVGPILKEVIAAKDRFKVLLCCGGGTRARHIYSIASDLEMPTGVLAALGGYVPMQNARMLQMLLASEGGIYILDDDFEKLPLYFRLGCIPIMTGMPPFGYWEKPGENTRIPANRTDAGVFLSAEALGAPRAIYVKDENGLFTDDPKKNPDAKSIKRVGAKELLAMNLRDMIVEPAAVEYVSRARFCKKLSDYQWPRARDTHTSSRGRRSGHHHLSRLTCLDILGASFHHKELKARTLRLLDHDFSSS